MLNFVVMAHGIALTSAYFIILLLSDVTVSRTCAPARTELTVTWGQALSGQSEVTARRVKTSVLGITGRQLRSHVQAQRERPKKVRFRLRFSGPTGIIQAEREVRGEDVGR